MTKIFKLFVRDESGAAAAEYALILAVIGAGIVAAAGALGVEVGRVVQEAADVIGAITIA